MDAVFFFNDTATTEIYTLSLHDALPISQLQGGAAHLREAQQVVHQLAGEARRILDVAQEAHAALAEMLLLEFDQDRKSTRLNSSHANISYAVFCLKKKENRVVCHRQDSA